MQPQIVSALRVKNEDRWIEEVLQALKWCSKIYLFDDNSTDDTRAIAERNNAKVMHSPFEGLDESRDKEYLVEKIAEEWGPEAWVLMVDGDEVLEPAGRGKILDSIKSNPGARAFSLPIYYLWNSRKQIRVDGVYGTFRRPSLFKIGTKYEFRRSGAPAHLHCSSVPAYLVMQTVKCDASLLHLGYMRREDRIRKWKYYNSIDPTNRVEGYKPEYPERGSYPHIVQGDIPEVPANIRIMHAGPLQLRELCL